jgi:hypothetical protein
MEIAPLFLGGEVGLRFKATSLRVLARMGDCLPVQVNMVIETFQIEGGMVGQVYNRSQGTVPGEAGVYSLDCGRVEVLPL